MAESPISTPKGGGAVSGLGEKFSPDLFTGTGNFSVPIAVPPGRNGLQPELSLQYSSGSGNGPWGLGWNLSIPGVTRKTAKGVPLYDDDKDTFILSGAEDLIPIRLINLRFAEPQLNEAGIHPLVGESGVIRQYRPRTEGLFAKIFHLRSNLRNCWKVYSKNGLISWYGSSEAFVGDVAVIQKPDVPESIFAWKLTKTEDTFGNHILYVYEKEALRINDYHEWDQTYLSEIKYADYTSNSGSTNYMVSVRFVYEERTDAFSEFKPGINVRTTRRCSNVLIFSNPDEGEIKVKTYHFLYSDTLLQPEDRPYNGVSLLCQVKVEGHDGNLSEFLPPLDFRYSSFKPKSQKFKKLKGTNLPLSSLANPGYELVDLFGNGLQDIVQINGAVRYWRNMGDGNFDAPRMMKDAPSGYSLGDPDVQLVDANGDGRTDLLINDAKLGGYYSMRHDASWDAKSFKRFKQAPSFSFSDPEVKLLDMSGDGITDAIRNGAALEIFYCDKDKGWLTSTRIPKKQIEDFPNVSFGDPRIKLADMTGDGLQDIVQVYSGSVRYWPNMGYGKFGKPVTMKNTPRFQYPFDPSRLLLSDIDGDGLADLIYIDSQKVTFWINQSGNGWSEPFEITGTPFVTNINGIRVTDLLGQGTAGLLYSFDSATNSQNSNWSFLDLTGGVKPYLLHEMDNNMGALTRVGYLPSTRHYLADQYGMSPFDASSPRVYKKRSPWKTTLPFPVQVVSRVEVINEISLGKLTTEYVYHHGYWDGGEREFRGFGRVDQRDTEAFERFIQPGLHGDQEFNQIPFDHYSPPIETRNWFHLGPVGDEFGDWSEVDFLNEYWQEDPNVLARDQATHDLMLNLPRRAKRDLFRVWRGSSLRSEMYALDQQDNSTGEYIVQSGLRPYTVSESVYGARLEADPDGRSGTTTLAIPKETSGYIFFSFSLGSRTTQWERGNDPMTQLSFTTDFDVYGQPRKQISLALPRGIHSPYTSGVSTFAADEGGGPILSTAGITQFAQKDQIDNGRLVYIVDRTCRSISYEIKQQAGENAFTMRDRVFAASLPSEVGNTLYPIIGFSATYFDAASPFGDGLTLGQIGIHGVPARSESLVLTDHNILDAYGSVPIFFQDANLDNYVTPPSLAQVDAAGYPSAFASALQNLDTRLGYKRHDHSTEPTHPSGWYAESGRTRYDWQGSSTGRGLPLETIDTFDAWATIEYDQYKLFPVTARQYLASRTSGGGDYLSTTAAYDYRVMQAYLITDPNGNRSIFGFSPLGLLKQSGLIGKDTITLPYSGYTAEGDLIDESIIAGKRVINYEPSVRMEYDFHSWTVRHTPVWVRTIQRTQHYQDQAVCDELIKVEYSDGFGRLLQARALAEDVIFGDSLFGDSGLPADQTAQNQPAVGRVRGADDDYNVVVSGWQVYNNKGKVVEKYEPFFDVGFDYIAPVDLSGLIPGLQQGEKIRMYYDPRGNVIRTVNPDDSEQWVIHGRPDSLDSVRVASHWSFSGYSPTPWEAYTYDANDLISIYRNSSSILNGSTPKNGFVDAMGRAVKSIDRLGQDSTDELVMHSTYDIQGNVLQVIDAANRTVFKHKYGIAKQPLWNNHLDSGISTALSDVAVKPIEAIDSKGARTLSSYDVMSRPKELRARDKTGDDFFLRNVTIYAEESAGLGLAAAAAANLAGKPYQHYDEAGLNQIEGCDFKGNPLEKFKQVISDDTLLAAGMAAYQVDWEGLDTSVLDATQYTTTATYDALNRGTSLLLPAEVGGHRSLIESVFNRAGALIKIKKDSEEYVKEIAYNAKGQQILAAWKNGIMMRFVHDPKTFRLSRVKAEGYSVTDSGNTHQYNYQSGTTRYDQAYSYDLMGNITAVSDRTPDCGVTGSTDILNRVFEYDSLYRLIYANGREMNTQADSYLFADAPTIGNPSASNCRYYEQEYTYDKVGNIQQLRHRVIGNTSLYYTRAFSYDTGNNKLTQVGSLSDPDSYAGNITYDNAGNTLTTNSDRAYLWNYANQMRTFSLLSGSGSVSIHANYLYDASGARVKKFVLYASGQYESKVYIDSVFEEYKKGTSLGVTEHRNYLYLPGGIEYKTGALDDPTESRDKYMITDYLGSAVIQLDHNGALYDTEEYYPYGDSSLRAWGKKRYRYINKEKDNESGLYQMGARYYSSWLCRFLSVDPLARKNAHESAFCYSGCNPIIFKDPSGLDKQESKQSQTNQVEQKSKHNKENTTGKLETRNSDGTLTGKSAPPTELKPVEVVAAKSKDISKKSNVGVTDTIKAKDNLKVLTHEQQLDQYLSDDYIGIEKMATYGALGAAKTIKKGASAVVHLKTTLSNIKDRVVDGLHWLDNELQKPQGQIAGEVYDWAKDRLEYVVTPPKSAAQEKQDYEAMGTLTLFLLGGEVLKTSSLGAIIERSGLGPIMEGFGVPKYYTFTFNGQSFYIAPHVWKHLEELLLNGRKLGPDYLKLIGKVYQESLESAIKDIASQGPIQYGKMYYSGGNEIMFGAPRAVGELPAVIHFR